MIGRMFIVTEEDAAAVRSTLAASGELAAAVELRRRFPGLNLSQARTWAVAIAGWRPTAPTSE